MPTTERRSAHNVRPTATFGWGGISVRATVGVQPWNASAWQETGCTLLGGSEVTSGTEINRTPQPCLPRAAVTPSEEAFTLGADVPAWTFGHGVQRPRCITVACSRRADFRRKYSRRETCSSLWSTRAWNGAQLKRMALAATSTERLENRNSNDVPHTGELPFWCRV
jgi:hypothetical protein